MSAATTLSFRPIATRAAAACALALAASIAAVSIAEARPDLRTMTCRDAQQTLARNGAVVFTTGPYTYDRYVSSHAYCDSWEEAVPAYEATRDAPQCRIGFQCQERLFRGRRGLFND